MKLWLNVADAAEHAGVCRDTIYTAVERGELRHVRIGGRRSIRVKCVWIDEWLERGTGPQVRVRPGRLSGTALNSGTI